MKICINIKVWQRPAVFRSVLRSIRDQATVHELILCCGVSDDDPFLRQNMATIEEFGAHPFMVKNSPLSEKANELARLSKVFEFDYLMILGSDDVAGPGFFDAYDFATEAWGWSDLYLWEPKNDDDMLPPRFCYWPGYNPQKRDESIGAGRILRRDVVEQLGWRLHNEGAGDLDATMSARLRAIGIEIPHGKLPQGVYLVDCKDSVSITKMGDFDQGALVELAVPDVLRGYL